MDEKTCCICGKKINGDGNNPSPIMRGKDEVCCDECYFKKVIPKSIQIHNYFYPCR